MNYHDQKIRRTPTHNIREHWTAASTLLGLISSVYRNLHHNNLWSLVRSPPVVILFNISLSNGFNFKKWVNISMWPWQVLPLRNRVNLGVMAMKAYSTFPKALELESHYQMQFIFISSEHVEAGVLPSLQWRSWCIL